MKIEELEQIEQKLIEGSISYEEASNLIYSNVKTPYRTKEWKKLRDTLIKDYCEQCKVTEPPFVLHHMWQPLSYNSHIVEKMDELITEELEKNPISISDVTEHEIEKYIKKNGENREVCPKCNSINFRFRKSFNPPYICNRCNHKFESPIVGLYLPERKFPKDVPNLIVQNKQQALREKVWEQNANEVRKYALLKGIEDSKRYMSCIDTVTYCKRCAFEYDHNHRELCMKCGVKYHYIGEECCRDCKEINKNSNASV
jgi:hypothetical protein